MAISTEGETKIVKSACAMCPDECGIDAYVENGKLVKVEGMKEHPINKGAICVKARQMPEYVYSDKRIKHPLKRVNGEWQRITWDEALDTITVKLKEAKAKHGGTSLAVFAGDPVGMAMKMGYHTIWRFCDAYGSPNLFYDHDLCGGAKHRGFFLTFGKTAGYDYDNTKCIVIWAQNTHQSWPTRVQHFNAALKRGAKLIVIDPKVTPFARQADIHIQPRPGTDAALAITMLNVIITEGLYDRDFVENYTMGFDRLSEHVKQFPPEWAESITRVKADDIRKVARMYATVTPGVIQTGCKLEQSASGVQTMRALATLISVTGNLDKIGGQVRASSGVHQKQHRLIDVGGAPQKVGADVYPIMAKVGGKFFGDGNMINFGDLILKGKPYPVTNMIVSGCNPAVTWPNTNKVREALRQVDFLVVMDPFLTPTAEFAHIVLPACTALERINLCEVYSNRGANMLRRKVIEPVGESWSDCKFWLALAKRMGYEKFFPWKDDEECLDYYLEPAGLSVKYLRDEHPTGIVTGQKHYDEYKEKGIKTPSGKVELYSTELERLGFDPMPTFTEPPESPLSTPELAKEYPLVLTTGARELEFWHSQFHDMPKLLQRNPGPKADMHPETAAKYGIKDGDTIYLETKRGSIELKARVTHDIIQGVVNSCHGWPQACENILTDDTPADPISGYPAYAAMLCRVRRKA